MDFDSGPAPHLNRLFLSTMKLGYTLNVCCGTDRTGDVLIDVDPRFKPTIVADLEHLPIRKGIFETIICDPPFSMYRTQAWIAELGHHARRRLIISTPLMLFRLGAAWEREVWMIDTAGHFMRIWQVFTRGGPHEPLNTFA